MLAAIAYPIQETLNPFLSAKLDLPNVLPLSKLSPSLINGELRLPILIFFLGIGSGLELYKMNVKSPIPADYKWRLTSFSPESADFFKLQEGEIWNGRLAMIAVLGYVWQEAITKMPVLSI